MVSALTITKKRTILEFEISMPSRIGRGMEGAFPEVKSWKNSSSNRLKNREWRFHTNAIQRRQTGSREAASVFGFEKGCARFQNFPSPMLPIWWDRLPEGVRIPNSIELTLQQPSWEGKSDAETNRLKFPFKTSGLSSKPWTGNQKTAHYIVVKN